MSLSHDLLGKKLSGYLLSKDGFTPASDSEQKVQILKPNNDVAVLDLTPFEAQPAKPDAEEHFAQVSNMVELEQAYHQIRKRYTFEDQLPGAMAEVSDYAQRFIDELFANARRGISDAQARAIAQFVKPLDAYTAVKCIESLLYSKADLKLLEFAAEQGWWVHYDHMAIRCGTQQRRNAEQVAQLLKTEHGYVAPQISAEEFYQFPDGWNAYPLYKILTNGQILRLFIDQSDGSSEQQIIQHWNRVYGYTPHHLGISAITVKNDEKQAVPLPEVIEVLARHGVQAMQPTGMYTHGLLQQVFTKPEKNPSIPQALKNQIAQVDEQLAVTVENAKLLEIVSRKEMPLDMAKEFFALYGLSFDADNPLHSAPIYQYFLPAQAAHVIKTSTQIERTG
jgi:hypothetical protein